MSALNSGAEYTARIHRVLEYVNNRMADDLSLKTLAEVGCFSPFHFHRIFTALVRETPLDFVRRVRLQRSALMLTHAPRESITAIALSCGFSSSATFSRAFRARFGMSPSSWREAQNSKIRKTSRKAGKASRSSRAYFRSSDRQTVHISARRNAMNVTLNDLPARHIAYVANLGGYEKSRIGAAWSRLCEWAGPLGLLEPPAQFMGLSFDDPAITPKDRCRYYACITVPPDVTPPRDIGLMTIPGGKHAVFRFDGTLDGIAMAYRDFYGVWLPASGHEPEDRPCYEVYHNSPEDDPEERIVMDICMPLKPL
jgi:AraC family transcriptional regulator